MRKLQTARVFYDAAFHHGSFLFQEKAVREKKIKKEARKRRKAAEKAGGAARAVGEQTEESTRVARPARKSLTDWRGKLTMAGFSTERSGTSRSFAGDVSSLVGKEKLVVQQREAYADKFIKIVRTASTVLHSVRVFFFLQPFRTMPGGVGKQTSRWRVHTFIQRLETVCAVHKSQIACTCFVVVPPDIVHGLLIQGMAFTGENNHALAPFRKA